MAHIVGHDLFRTLKACRSIERSHADILSGLAEMQDSALQTRASLETATANLERSLGAFTTARERLQRVNDQHAEVMRRIEDIRASSPAFQDLN